MLAKLPSDYSSTLPPALLWSLVFSPRLWKLHFLVGSGATVGVERGWNWVMKFHFRSCRHFRIPPNKWPLTSESYTYLSLYFQWWWPSFALAVNALSSFKYHHNAQSKPHPRGTCQKTIPLKERHLKTPNRCYYRFVTSTAENDDTLLSQPQS